MKLKTQRHPRIQILRMKDRRKSMKLSSKVRSKSVSPRPKSKPWPLRIKNRKAREVIDAEKVNQ